MSAGVELFSTQADGGRLYSPASPAHVARCAALLSELSATVSAAPAEIEAKPIFVRLAHYEHGAFLNPMLFGVSVLAASGKTLPSIVPPGLAWQSVAQHVLDSPDASSVDRPFSYAVIANHTAPVQMESAIMTLASLIERRKVSDRLLSTGDVSGLDVETEAADSQAAQSVRDLMRSEGWRAAAEAIRRRALASGNPLAVRYDASLFSRDDLANRAPILRRVYNEMSQAREAVDKSVALASLGMFVEGGGSLEVARFSRDLLDVGRSRQFTAHALRDAYVCGNGYLSFGEMPDEDMRLLAPEFVEMDGEVAVEREPNRPLERHQRVLHLRGAEQASGDYGLSVLEPYVQLQQMNDLMRRLRDQAEAWSGPGFPRVAKEWAELTRPLAERTLAANEAKASDLAPAPLRLKVPVPEDLYVRGHRLMARAALGLTMTDGPSDGAAVPT